MRVLTILLSAMTLSSCTTMEFVNGPKMENTVIREAWHHQGLNGLIEFSKPLDLDYHCDQQQWDSVTIEKTFFNNVAGLSYPYLTLYSPWTIVYECREAID